MSAEKEKKISSLGKSAKNETTYLDYHFVFFTICLSQFTLHAIVHFIATFPTKPRYVNNIYRHGPMNYIS